MNKLGAFTPDEFEAMKSHVQHGHKELMNAISNGAPIDEIVARVALEHHERFTGKAILPVGVSVGKSILCLASTFIPASFPSPMRVLHF